MGMSAGERNWVGEEIIRHLSVLASTEFSLRSKDSARYYIDRLGDELTRELTSFESLVDMCQRWTDHGYRPTIIADRGIEYRALADLYDYHQKLHGVDVVAYRG